MTFAVGSQYELGYIAEVTYATTPGSPALTKARITGDSLELVKDSFLSNELRSDREISDFRHGNKSVAGNLDFEFSFGAFDDMLLAVLGASAWTTSATITGTGIAFVNGTPDTITDTGNGFVTAGFEVGDSVTITGAGSGSNLNLVATVTNVAAGTLTMSGTAIVAQAAGGSVTLTAARKYAKTGVAVKSFSMERRFMDAGVYQLITGVRVNTFSLSVQPNGIVTGSFGVLGKNLTTSDASVDATATENLTNSVFDSFTGYVKENGSTISNVTGIELNLNNNLNPGYALFSQTLQQVFEERANLSGTMTMFLEDETYLNKFENETVTSLEFRLTDVSGNYYDFVIPRLKYGQGSAPVNAFGGIIVTFPFQAYRDPTVGASFKIEKSS